MNQNIKKKQEDKIKILKDSIQLSSSELKIIYNMKMNKLDKVFQQYCKIGDFDMIKYLLTSPDLELNYDINYNNAGFIYLCKNNNEDIILYLLTSPELKYKFNLNDGSDLAINIACEHGHLNLVKLFLTGAQLKFHSNIYSLKSRAINIAFEKKHTDIIDFLIKEYKLDLTKIYTTVKDKYNLEEKINLAQLHEKLSNELPLKNDKNKGMKL